MMQDGSWRQPSQEAWHETVPWILDDDDRLTLNMSIDGMVEDTALLERYVDRGRHVYSSVESKEHLNDPDWIDAERAVGIGGSEVPGADLLIVLDLRSTPDDPRVLISDWRADGNVLVHHWRLVAPILTSFLHRLGLTQGASQ